MTVSSDVSKITYQAGGGVTEYDVPFIYLATLDVEVVHRAADGVETVWLEGSQYNLSASGETSGGTLTVATSPVDYTLQAGETLTIRRKVPVTQGTDYQEAGRFPAETHEQALDKLTMIAQQLVEAAGRTLTVPVSDQAGEMKIPIDDERSGKFLAFDAEGLPIAAAGTSSDLTPVSAFINTLLDDADAVTFLTTLGGGSAGIALFGDETAEDVRTTIGAQEDLITTQGDLLIGNSSGTAERLARGTDNQVLRMDGITPVWEDLPAAVPAGISHLQRFTLSASTTIDFENLDWSTYQLYMFVLRAQVSASLDLHARMGFGDPPVYLTGASDYAYSGLTHTGPANIYSNGAALIRLTGSTWYKGGVGYNEGGLMMGHVMPSNNPAGSDGIGPGVMAKSMNNRPGTGNMSSSEMLGHCRSSFANPTGIRIYTSTGNLVDGFLDFYGVRGNV